jgi:uncharacterized protein YecT (DUF1311 family)
MLRDLVVDRHGSRPHAQFDSGFGGRGVIAAPSAWAQEHAPQPYELTSRGVIAADAGEAYRLALESCYHGKPGDAPLGPQFLACLKQQYRNEGGTLAKTFNGALAALKSSADRAAKLRDAQSAWTKFRDSNCSFARAVAPAEETDAFYYDCLLRATVERRIELRSLVGD